MKVTKDQIVNGVLSFAEVEVVPQIGDKATQILIAIFVKAAKANPKLADSLFENHMLKTFLKADEEGYYDIDEAFGYITEALHQYGPFPVEIPAVPFISPSEKTLSFNESDISEIKKRIERSN